MTTKRKPDTVTVRIPREWYTRLKVEAARRGLKLLDVLTEKIARGSR